MIPLDLVFHDAVRDDWCRAEAPDRCGIRDFGFSLALGALAPVGVPAYAEMLKEPSNIGLSAHEVLVMVYGKT